MRQTKYVVTQFTFYDRTGIQRMLEKQARKGWLLESIHPFAWKYRRIEPKKLHFAVTYFPKASAFDPYPSRQEEFYREFCAHSGWILAASNAQLQVFYNEAEDPVPIETDALMEVENIHKAAIKSYLTSYFLLLGCAVLQLSLMIYRLCVDFLGTLSSNANLFTMLCWLMLFAMEVTEISAYYLWRHRALKAAKLDGSFVATRNTRPLQSLCLAVILIGFCALLYSYHVELAVAILTCVGLILSVTLLMQPFSNWLKKKGISREDNRTITIAVTVVLCIAVMVLSVKLMISAVSERQEMAHEQVEYAHNGFFLTSYRDELPLTVEDLTGETDEGYSMYRDVKSSLVLDKLVARQDKELGSSGPGLRYVVVEVKLPLLYEACLRDFLKTYQGQTHADIFGNTYDPEFTAIDPKPWGADRAYQLYYLEDSAPEYLLCYGNRIVNFDFSEEPTPEQMCQVAKVLGNVE